MGWFGKGKGKGRRLDSKGARVIGQLDKDGTAGGLEPGDRLGAWTKRARTGDPSRGLRVALRGSVIMNVALVFALMAAVSAIGAIAPLRRDVPYFLASAAQDGQVVEVAPLRTNSQTMTIVEEREAIGYVRYRFEVIPDLYEMNRRWGKSCLEGVLHVEERLCAYVYSRSALPVYLEFRDQNLEQVQEMINRGVSRRVEIDMDPIHRGDGQWEIRFAAVDYTPEKNGEPRETRRRYFAATLWVSVGGRQEVERRARFINPVNFKVERFHLAEIQASEATRSGEKAQGGKKK